MTFKFLDHVILFNLRMESQIGACYLCGGSCRDLCENPPTSRRSRGRCNVVPNEGSRSRISNQDTSTGHESDSSNETDTRFKNPIQGAKQLIKNITSINDFDDFINHSNLIFRFQLKNIPKNISDFRGRWGYFYEYYGKKINFLKKIVNRSIPKCNFVHKFKNKNNTMKTRQHDFEREYGTSQGWVVHGKPNASRYNCDLY